MQSVLLTEITRLAQNLVSNATPRTPTKAACLPDVDDALATFRSSIQVPDMTGTLRSMTLSNEKSELLQSVYHSKASQLIEMSCVTLRKTLLQMLPLVSTSSRHLSVEATKSRLVLFFLSMAEKNLGQWKMHFLQSVEMHLPTPPRNAATPAQLSAISKKAAFNNDFTPVLMQYFARNAYPSAKDRDTMAVISKMSSDQITNWFQNHRNRAKKEGTPIKRLSGAAARKVSNDILSQLDGQLVSSEMDDSEESDYELVYEADDEESPFKESAFAAVADVSFQSFPTPYLWPAHQFRPNQASFCSSTPTEWMRKPSCVGIPVSTQVNFDDLCDRFSRLRIQSKESASSLPAPEGKKYSQAWFNVTKLSNGRHPSYIPIKDRHLYEPYRKSTITSPAEATPKHNFARKKASLAKRVPQTRSHHHPHMSSPRSSPLQSTSRVPSDSTMSTTSSSSYSRASSESSYSSSSSEGPSTPRQESTTISLPVIATPGFDFDVGFGSFGEGDMDDLFGSEEQLDNVLKQFLAATASSDFDQSAELGFPPYLSCSNGMAFASEVHSIPVCSPAR